MFEQPEHESLLVDHPGFVEVAPGEYEPREAKNDPKIHGPHIERLELTKELDLPLNEHAIAERAMEAAMLAKDIDDMEIRQAGEKKRMRDEMDEAVAHLRGLMANIRTAKETRLVPCTLIRDWNEFAIRYEHEGRIVDERPMTVDERQMDIPFKPQSLKDLDGIAINLPPTERDIKRAELKHEWEHGLLTADEYHEEMRKLEPGIGPGEAD